MQKDKIEHLREIINEMIVSNDCDYNVLVEISQELDKLILEAMKETFPTNSMKCEKLPINAMIRDESKLIIFIY